MLDATLIGYGLWHAAAPRRGGQPEDVGHWRLAAARPAVVLAWDRLDVDATRFTF